MTLHLYDSATRSVREFTPLVPGRVGMYVCGATVQGEPHVGHLRSAVAFDVLVRWLRRSGLEVTLVRNVTDIDDKILDKAREAGVPWWAWAYRHEGLFTAAYDAIGIAPPTYEPRATGHVPDMVELMRLLVESGHAYTGASGNVWFDVRSLPSYGSLTRQLLENLSVDAGAESGPEDKRHPHDFALWKAPRDGEAATASWDTPYGRGRPGWHLECSAMARRYLGETFDIHGGGIDLRFPHHENEQAQSRAAGFGFARYWLHNAWVTSGGEKMSKSLGNYLSVAAVLERTDPAVLRFALAVVHYRSTVEFSDATLTEAATTWERLAGFVTRAAEAHGEDDGDAVAAVDLPPAFAAAMDDDVNVAAALAVVHDHVRRGNAALAAGDADAARSAALAVRGMLDVLGLDPLAPRWRSGDGSGAVQDALASLVASVLAQRRAAREAKDWARADELRDVLTAAGVAVEDAAGGARWTIKGQ
ncbi:cysteine--tRNA ligase [Litorihabitans aurantiacus]|uniref:Cysteine--tRNA ligase n=1 Tax=Litorihabitans aurantiacus TaxID=1930061 RepID=A0AA37XFN6_9MICO|nr:cysteine--tRNA ligase [Litorihabitans aurantiacus]GMA32430.1 cysteine--tRNA ligase [Litorihabitans aurantiacus]